MLLYYPVELTLKSEFVDDPREYLGVDRHAPDLCGMDLWHCDHAFLNSVGCGSI